MLSDCAFVLQRLSLRDPKFTPSFALLERIVNKYDLAVRLMNCWRETSYDESDFEQRAFVDRVEGDAFHILKANTITGRRESEWALQVTWRLEHARNVLSLFSQGAMLEKFSASHGKGLDLAKWLFTEKKIVVLRFSSKTGGPGRVLARLIKERFYSEVFARFDICDPDQDDPFVFSILDEFQDILTFGERAGLDDFAWFCRAREFKVINLAASQSLSSLYPKWGASPAVDALRGPRADSRHWPSPRRCSHRGDGIGVEYR